MLTGTGANGAFQKSESPALNGIVHVTKIPKGGASSFRKPIKQQQDLDLKLDVWGSGIALKRSARGSHRRMDHFPSFGM